MSPRAGWYTPKVFSAGWDAYTHTRGSDGAHPQWPVSASLLLLGLRPMQLASVWLTKLREKAQNHSTSRSCTRKAPWASSQSSASTKFSLTFRTIGPLENHFNGPVLFFHVITLHRKILSYLPVRIKQFRAYCNRNLRFYILPKVWNKWDKPHLFRIDCIQVTNNNDHRYGLIQYIRVSSTTSMINNALTHKPDQNKLTRPNQMYLWRTQQNEHTAQIVL